jgi:putative tryptophan/tyrosine transport system substrate-binding protein
MAIHVQRRAFVGALGGAAALPLVARAQQPTMPVVGFLNSTSSDGYEPMVAAFRQGLKETGYIESQNVAIEYRWAGGQYDRVPALAAELVRRHVVVIVANTPANLAAKAATSTIPIVFTTGGDPVQMGLVASLNRPGGNITGVTQVLAEVAPKRLELAHEMVPTATVIAVLLNPTNPNSEVELRDLQAAAGTLGLHLHVLHASVDHDFDTIFASLAQRVAGALVILDDPFFTARHEQLAALALRHAVPMISYTREFVVAGGLMGYGVNIPDTYRLAGIYAGRILKGEKPADLPVQQSTKVELFVNLKTAKALRLTVPNSLLGRADELID